MTIRVPMQVANVDLDAPEVDELLGEFLDDLLWSSADGIVLATLFAEQSPVEAALEAARRIQHHLAGAHVERVDEGLVGISDIAARLGVSRETVRSWVNGSRGPGGFPRHRDSLGSGSSKGAVRIWPWAEVNRWLAQLELDDGFTYPNDHDVAKLNACFAQVDSAADSAWKRVSAPMEQPVTISMQAQVPAVMGVISTRLSEDEPAVWVPATRLLEEYGELLGKSWAWSSLLTHYHSVASHYEEAPVDEDVTK